MYSTIEEVYQFLQSRRALGIKLGLERMEKMLDLLERPEQQLKTIHIAGTNGKGSTLTFIQEVLIQSGYTVGTFTSPSIDRFNDHIHLNHDPISDQDLIAMVNEVIPVIKKLDKAGDAPTEYEIVVILAIIFFRKHVDIALFETNMGGRDDSSNCVHPLLTIITNIGFDHVNFLGKTYQEIAAHKAGIIKQGVPVIIGNLHEDALPVIKQETWKKAAPIYRYGPDFRVGNVSFNSYGLESFTFETDGFQKEIVISMKGRHQVMNTAIAMMAVQQLKKSGFRLNETTIQTGLEQASIPGRFEQVHTQPMIIVDGAHNAEGVKTFVDTVNRYYPDADKQLLFTAFKDKPWEEMLLVAGKTFNTITLTTFSHPRAIAETELNRFAKTSQCSCVQPEWKLAISDFIVANDSKRILFVTGSLHFIGLVKKYIDKTR